MVVPHTDEVTITPRFVLKARTKISIQPDLERYQDSFWRLTKLLADALLPALRDPFQIALGNQDEARLFILVELRAGVGERLVADHDAKLVSAFGRNRGFNGVENAQLSDGDRIDREPCRAKVSTSLLDDVRPVAVEFVVAVDDVTPFEDGEI